MVVSCCRRDPSFSLWAYGFLSTLAFADSGVTAAVGFVSCLSRFSHSLSVLISIVFDVFLSVCYSASMYPRRRRGWSRAVREWMLLFF